jgi:hypothetical protein
VKASLARPLAVDSRSPGELEVTESFLFIRKANIMLAFSVCMCEKGSEREPLPAREEEKEVETRGQIKCRIEVSC